MQLSISTEKQGTIAVTQEAKTVAESIVVDSLPIATDKSGNQQNQSAFRLVEISYQKVDKPETELRDNYNPSADFQIVKTIFLKISYDRIKRLFC